MGMEMTAAERGTNPFGYDWDERQYCEDGWDGDKCLFPCSRLMFMLNLFSSANGKSIRELKVCIYIPVFT